MRNRRVIVYLLVGVWLISAGIARAQLPRMGPPIPTTIVVTKPAPGEIFGNKQTVTMGVGTKSYKFVLNDAYTNHLKFKWADIWQYVQQFNPNFVVQGQDADTFEKIQPGQTVTITGAFAPMDRTFEVLTVEPSSLGQHY
jgi:hypothetical protein